MKELPDSLEQLEKELERERAARRRDSASEPRLMGFDVHALLEVKKWLEIYGLNEQPTEENVRAVFARLTPCADGRREEVVSPLATSRAGTWMRGGDRRFNLLDVVSYEPSGCQIQFFMRGGGAVWWSPSPKEGVEYHDQMKSTVAMLDEFFGVRS